MYAYIYIYIHIYIYIYTLYMMIHGLYHPKISFIPKLTSLSFIANVIRGHRQVLDAAASIHQGSKPAKKKNRREKHRSMEFHVRKKSIF